MVGVCAAIRSKSSMLSSTPASRATASRCSTPLVEPPLVAIAAIEFSSASRVMMSRGRWPRASTSMISAPASIATRFFSSYAAGTIAEPIGEMPSTSKAIAIVFAVNWPPQAPMPGEATSSSSCRSASEILPAARAPIASNTSTIVTSWPRKWPGRIEPP